MISVINILLVKGLEIDGFKIEFCENTYIPSDDTYLLYDSIKSLEKIMGPALEIGCGIGLISLKLASKNVRVVSIDINPYAVKCTYNNAKRNNLDKNIDVICCNMFDALREGIMFNLIVFNPPYLPYNGEKLDNYSRAYIGGLNGSEITKFFLKDVHKYLDDNGIIYLLQSSISDIIRRKPIIVKKIFFEELRIYRLDKHTLRTLENNI